MDKFINLKGIAAPFNFINVDTDKIIPKQFLKTIKRTGLGKHLFDEMRFNDDGTEKKGFVLNEEPYRSSNIIVAGDNFGCGSSREHAPWALSDFGIKCIDNPELEIDLPSQEIRRPNGAVIKFEIDPFRKKCLIEGLDDIGLTMQKSNEIKKFEKKMTSERPWL